LQGNPWRCSCENVWLGSWLRRWMRETLQLHTSGVERDQAIREIVRTITCGGNGGGGYGFGPAGLRDRSRSDGGGNAVPLVSLDRDVGCFQRAQISAASRTLLASQVRSTLVVIAVFAARRLLPR